MFKKVFKIVFYVSIPVIVFALLGLSVESNSSAVYNSFVVNVDHSCGNKFIDAEEIKKEIYESFDTVAGQKLNQISLSKIEDFIKGVKYVRKANVYRTIDGTVKADVIQRKPIARVVNKLGESFYIDTDGKLMPLDNDYTARVMIVSGEIGARYTPLIDLKELSNDEFGEKEYNLLKDIYFMAEYVNDHAFLGPFIDQIYVNADNNFELIAKNGSHTVEFGGIERMEQKFSKLMVFYNYGLTKMGWNKYSRINLKYKNQVVCAK